MKRVFGPTLMEKIINWGQGNQIKHFFFGSTQLILEKMSAVIQKKFPAAIVRGMISPPFKSLSPNENLEFISQINDLNPDIIWVGLGAPKQEKWMYENYQKLNKGIMIGVGAGFDYLAGETHHAPDWMKNYSLEWLYRLIQDPQRLWKRYLITNPLFILMNTLELLNLKTYD
jgi:N-acetylglucosaminyldiphosphoundecaprenol N-acetyl-beta-D-mannosaminyltransferase